MLGLSLQVWEVLGTWVAGVGTLTAVAWSIWLSHRDARQDLQIEVSLIGTDIYGEPIETPELNVVVTNHGARPARVVQIQLRARPGRGDNWAGQVATEIIHEGAVRFLPHELAHGEQLWARIKLHGGLLPSAWGGRFRASSWWRRWDVLVDTSLQRRFHRRLHRASVDQIIAEIEANKPRLTPAAAPADTPGADPS